MDLYGIMIMFVVIVLTLFLAYKLCMMEFNIDKNSIGRNHTSIVTSCCCGGDIHFDEMTDEELINTLRYDYNLYKNLNKQCINAKDPTHLVEYRIFVNKKGDVKTIGYITKDKVVFEEKEYEFDSEDKICSK